MKCTIASIGLVFFVTLLASLEMSAAAEPRESPPVKIGLLLALTGDFSLFGTDAKLGAELAAAEINEHSKSAVLFFQDDRCLPLAAVKGYQQLSKVENVNIIVGSGCTGNIVAVGPLAERDKLPVIALLDANAETMKAGKTTFVIGFDAADLAGIVADEMIRRNLKRAAVLAEADAWAKFVQESFEARFQAGGGQVLASVVQQPSDPDYRPNILRMSSKKPDALYLIPAYNGGNLIKQIRAGGISLPLFGPDTLANQTALSIAGTSAENIVFANVVLDETQNSVSGLQEKLKKKFGKAADTVFYAALGYDAVQIAYRAARSNTGAVEALRSFRCTTCVNPISEFDQDRFAKIAPSLLTVANGKPVPPETPH